MNRGLYTAASGMLATTVATDVMADNLANVNTTAYKRESVSYQSFSNTLLQKMNGDSAQPIGQISGGSKVYGTTISFTQGPMQDTGNTFDMAIDGDGFFTVKQAGTNNLYQTRAGNFTVNDQGFLVTQQGDYVQGRLGNIQLLLDQAPIKISADGTVTAKGRTIDQLKISRFSNNNSLTKVGDNLYQTTASSQPLPDPANGQSLGFKIAQGKLEGSNTNVVSELVNNIQGMRLYEALDKNIHMQNDSLTKVVNEVGSPK